MGSFEAAAVAMLASDGGGLLAGGCGLASGAATVAAVEFEASNTMPPVISASGQMMVGPANIRVNAAMAVVVATATTGERDLLAAVMGVDNAMTRLG
jgi:hypothetical protein